MSRVELVAVLLFVLLVVEWCEMGSVVGVPTRFLGNLDDREVSVIWIVKVTRVVDVYHGLVGRSRSGGVRRVEEAGDVRSAGSGSVLMLSKHSVFERSSQEHDPEGGGGGRDGGWRGGWDGTEGRMTYLYTGRVAQNAVLASNALSFIFSRGAHSNFRIGVSVYNIIIFRRNFKLGDLSIFIFRSTFPDAELRLVQRVLYLNVALRWHRVSRLSLALTNPF